MFVKPLFSMLIFYICGTPFHILQFVHIHIFLIRHRNLLRCKSFLYYAPHVVLSRYIYAMEVSFYCSSDSSSRDASSHCSLSRCYVSSKQTVCLSLSTSWLPMFVCKVTTFIYHPVVKLRNNKHHALKTGHFCLLSWVFRIFYSDVSALNAFPMHGL